tara:strand:- start:11522 stop:14578 length:3057 start_codon:yes stop_codon:yes gene_type:complete
METEVGSFRGVDKVNQGYKWDKTSALDFFYQFIIPQDKSISKVQRRIRRGLVKWIRDKSEWSNNKNISFDTSTFDSINRDVINILLDTKLQDLNQNRYFAGTEEPEEKAFADKTIERVKSNGEVENIPINYGRTFAVNKKGLNIEDSEAYNVARNLIIESKNELQALKLERDNAEGKAKTAFKSKITKIEKAIQENEEKYYNELKTMFDDNITLRQVMNNDPDIENFYSAVSMEPKTEQEKLALGLLIEVVEKTINEDLYNTKYSFLTGKSLTYQEFTKKIREVEAEYLSILAIPFMVSAKLTGVKRTEEGVEIPIDMDKLVEFKTGQMKYDKEQDKNVPDPTSVKTSVIQLADQLSYPIKMSSEDLGDIDNKGEFLEFVKTMDKELVVNLLERAVNNWSKTNLEPLLNVVTNVTIINKKLEERGRDDITDRPVRMTRETIEEFILQEFVNPDNVTINLKQVETNKSKFKMPITINKKLVDFESAYARTVGGSSRNIISSELPVSRKATGVNKKGNVVINYEGNIDKDTIETLPGIGGDYQWKLIRDTLVNFYRAKTTSTEERIQNKIKGLITSGLIGDMEMIIGIIKDIKTISGESMVEDDEDDFKLNNFKPSIFLDNSNNFRYSVRELRDKLYTDTKIQSNNFINGLGKFQISMNAIMSYIEENDDLINTLEDAMENLTEDELTQEEERAKEKLQSEQLRATQSAQERREEEEKEKEDALQGTEGYGALAQAMSEESIEEFDDDLTGKTFLMMRDEDLMNQIRELKKYSTVIDNLNFKITELRNSLGIIQDTKDVNITTDNFEKILNEWSELTGYTKMDDLVKLIKQIDEEKDEEGKFVNDMTDLKENIKEERFNIETFWNETKQQDKFKVPSEADMIRLINALDLRTGLSEDLLANDLFNDGRNGEVSLESSNLEVQIDYSKKKLLLKGKIKWVSAKESYIGYKIQSGKVQSYRMPKVPRAGLRPDQAKRIGNKPVGPTGREQSKGLIGENTDSDRLEFLNQIKSRMNVLVQAVR